MEAKQEFASEQVEKINGCLKYFYEDALTFEKVSFENVESHPDIDTDTEIESTLVTYQDGEMLPVHSFMDNAELFYDIAVSRKTKTVYVKIIDRALGDDNEQKS